MTREYMLARIHVPYSGAAPLSGRDGIVLLGLMPVKDFPALLLIWDEGPSNTGSSATNCMGELLLWAQQNWLDFPVKESVILQRDSFGEYVHIFPEWSTESSGQTRLSPLVNFRPIRWPGTRPCSEEALKQMLGERIEDALQQIAVALVEDQGKA